MVNVPHPTINERLPLDVMWTIFLRNSVNLQEEMRTRLRNTIITTHVCREWRNLVVGGTSIWGSLLLFDYRRGLNKPWIQQIIERSGEARLWVEIRGRPAVENPGNILRIERFKASVKFYSRIELDLFFLPLLCYPAPTLQEADYTAQRIQDSQISTLITPQSSTKLHALFSDTAPHLRALKADRLRIPLRASWLSGLTSLETGPRSHFTADIQQTLQVLGRMSQLQRLILGHTIHSVVGDNVEISMAGELHKNYSRIVRCIISIFPDIDSGFPDTHAGFPYLHAGFPRIYSFAHPYTTSIGFAYIHRVDFCFAAAGGADNSSDGHKYGTVSEAATVAAHPVPLAGSAPAVLPPS
ncbi:hypothetical protein CPC08DRAFT_728413 [Agrocybe pediades]|nr:hypothetical protein CPC08DRAFT_728413 [Agrocybe pediades]